MTGVGAGEARAGADPALERASEAWARALGDGFSRHDPDAFDGVAIGVTLRPPDAGALAEVLRVASAHDVAVLVRGGGTNLACGNALRRAGAWLDTRRLSGIRTLDAEEGVARADAGTPLATLREAVADTGWELPLDPPGAQSTLGGALSAAASGPRFGHPRDVVLGLDVVLADGSSTRCGGRVVKNVTGYDLAKLYVGAFGSLGVLASAWLRLRPRPEAQAVLAAPLPAGDAATGPALVAARLGSARVAACLDPALAAAALPGAGPGAHLVVELAGDAGAVAADREALARDTGAEPVPAETVDRVRALQAEPAPEDGLRVRVSSLPTRWAAAAAECRGAGASVLAYPGRGLLFAQWPLADAEGDGPDRALAAARHAARVGGGTFRLDAAPARVRAGREVFGDPGEELPLLRALKARFDPRDLLNPGRFAGGR